jgi:hypothetical protein
VRQTRPSACGAYASLALGTYLPTLPTSSGFALALAGSAASREGLARPSARARAQRAGVAGEGVGPKVPEGGSEGWQGVGQVPSARQTLRGFPSQSTALGEDRAGTARKQRIRQLDAQVSGLA